MLLQRWLQGHELQPHGLLRLLRRLDLEAMVRRLDLGEDHPDLKAVLRLLGLLLPPRLVDLEAMMRMMRRLDLEAVLGLLVEDP